MYIILGTQTLTYLKLSPHTPHHAPPDDSEVHLNTVHVHYYKDISIRYNYVPAVCMHVVDIETLNA